MNEDELFAMLGRATALAETRLRDYRQLLALVVRIKAGNVHPDEVVVNMTEASWRVVELPREEPAGPDDGEGQELIPIGGNGTGEQTAQG